MNPIFGSSESKYERFGNSRTAANEAVTYQRLQQGAFIRHWSMNMSCGCEGTRSSPQGRGGSHQQLEGGYIKTLSQSHYPRKSQAVARFPLFADNQWQYMLPKPEALSPTPKPLSRGSPGCVLSLPSTKRLFPHLCWKRPTNLCEPILYRDQGLGQVRECLLPPLLMFLTSHLT